MPSNKAIHFLLASVTMKKQYMQGKFINGNSGNKRKKNE